MGDEGTREEVRSILGHPMKALAFLRRNPVLARGGGAALRLLAGRSEVRLYDTGAVVTRAGSPQTHVIMIADGRVELHRKNRKAGTQFLVGLLEAPQVFGDAELYAGVRWSVSATAVEPTTAVLMPNEDYDRMVSTDGGIAAGLYRDSCARHMLVIQIMQFLALQRTEHQILRLLFDLAPAPPSPGDPVVAPLSQVRLAQALGVNRKTIARNLKMMERGGLIETKRGEAVLLVPREVVAIDDLTVMRCFGASWRLGEMSRR